MDLYRFNYFMADYLEEFVRRTGDWDKADELFGVAVENVL